MLSRYFVVQLTRIAGLEVGREAMNIGLLFPEIALKPIFIIFINYMKKLLKSINCTL